MEFDEEVHEEHEWNMWWKTSRFRTSDYNQLYPWQRVNHCPKATGICYVNYTVNYQTLLVLFSSRVLFANFVCD